MKYAEHTMEFSETAMYPLYPASAVGSREYLFHLYDPLSKSQVINMELYIVSVLGWDKK